jgi:hypothetical protein
MKVLLLENDIFVYGDEIIAKGSELGESIWMLDNNARNNAIAGCGPISQLQILDNELKYTKDKKVIFVLSDVFRKKFTFFDLTEEYLTPFCRTHESLKLLSRELWVKHAKHVPFISEYFNYVVDVPVEYEVKQLDLILCKLLSISSGCGKLLIINRGHNLNLHNKIVPNNTTIVNTNKASENAKNNFDEKLLKSIKKWIKT